MCDNLEKKYVKSSEDSLASILSITREVMEVTITEEDLQSITMDDVPAISREKLNSVIMYRDHLESLYRFDNSTTLYDVTSETSVSPRRRYIWA